jgi:proteasome lid subunit RPN8/RPN11
MLHLSRSLVRACSAAAKAAHPNEALALLLGRKEANGDLYLTRLLIPPGLSLDEDSAYFDAWSLPSDTPYLGVFHSHPSGGASPSDEDILASGHEGGVQLILASPYAPGGLRAYHPDGTPLEYSVID